MKYSNNIMVVAAVAHSEIVVVEFTVVLVVMRNYFCTFY